MTRWTTRVFLAALLVSAASAVAAHAELERAVPAAGSAVRKSPPRLMLMFSQRLEPAFSKVSVLTRTGKRIDIADSKVDAVDATRLSVGLPKLAPGTYRVRWRVLSVDTHVSEGDFTFDVRP
jgi:copper resistance protein C